MLQACDVQMIPCRMLLHAEIPADLHERFWGLWLAAPLLCTVQLPVKLNKNKGAVFKGVSTLGRTYQYDFLVEPQRRGDGEPKNSSQKLWPSSDEVHDCPCFGC
jgi:hypothetical protein